MQYTSITKGPFRKNAPDRRKIHVRFTELKLSKNDPICRYHIINSKYQETSASENAVISSKQILGIGRQGFAGPANYEPFQKEGFPRIGKMLKDRIEQISKKNGFGL
jgi:hypothetical protein